jgi:hypothetical protein
MLKNRMDTSKYLTYDTISYIKKRGLYLWKPIQNVLKSLKAG